MLRAVNKVPVMSIVVSIRLPCSILNPPLTPIHIKPAGTLAALECVSADGGIDWNSQQFAAVWTLDFRGASDGSRDAEFVVDEVVEEKLVILSHPNSRHETHGLSLEGSLAEYLC